MSDLSDRQPAPVGRHATSITMTRRNLPVWLKVPAFIVFTSSSR